MSESKYVDILLAQNDKGETRTFVVPTSTAHEGYLILHDGALFTVINRAWFDLNGDKYPIIEGSTTLYTPDKILAVMWEKEELEAGNGTVPGDS